MTPSYKIVHNVLTDNELAFIKRFAQDNLTRLTSDGGNVNDVYNNLTIQMADVDSARAKDIMRKVNDAGLSALRELFGEDALSGVESDGIMINKWPIGMGLGDHADNAFAHDGSPNYTWWRNFSGVFYINDDYEGGEFYFCDTDIVIKPVANSLTVFGAGLDSVHGVHPVTDGDRWTMPNWFTNNPEYYASRCGSMGLPIGEKYPT